MAEDDAAREKQRKRGAKLRKAKLKAKEKAEKRAAKLEEKRLEAETKIALEKTRAEAEAMKAKAGAGAGPTKHKSWRDNLWFYAAVAIILGVLLWFIQFVLRNVYE